MLVHAFMCFLSLTHTQLLHLVSHICVNTQKRVCKNYTLCIYKCIHPDHGILAHAHTNMWLLSSIHPSMHIDVHSSAYMNMYTGKICLDTSIHKLWYSTIFFECTFYSDITILPILMFSTFLFYILSVLL